MNKFRVIILPSHRKGESSEGETLLNAARESGVEIESLCLEISQPEKPGIRKTVIERTIKLKQDF